MDELKGELETLKRLLYQNKSQHGSSDYFQRVRSGFRLLSKYVEGQKIMDEITRFQVLQKGKEHFDEAALGLFGLLKRGFFVHFSVAYLACVSKILGLVKADYEKLGRRFLAKKQADFGTKVERSSLQQKEQEKENTSKTTTTTKKKQKQKKRPLPSSSSSCIGRDDVSDKAKEMIQTKDMVCEKEVHKKKKAKKRKTKDEIDSIFGDL